ncbi:MAG TPA: hypothetical protein PLV79_06270, partial [Bacteroidales bacterium]|nr:hypothetical protein [Bacteroidales bacterium]HOV55841.1 hypothetical protein [Bacteroidales bacterium]
SNVILYKLKNIICLRYIRCLYNLYNTNPIQYFFYPNPIAHAKRHISKILLIIKIYNYKYKKLLIFKKYLTSQKNNYNEKVFIVE